MRFKLVCWNLGKISMILSVTMLLPIIWSLAKGEQCFYPLLLTCFLTLSIAVSLLVIFRKSRNQTLRHREGFALVTIGWLLAAFLGALPYFWTGMIPDFAGAFFESMSGFTTTGATVLPVIESYEQGMLMWRMVTHWLGGMGIVVLVVALSAHSKGSSNLFNAETPGSSHIERLTPKISQTSMIMWATYLALTIVLIILLWIEGMSFFDAVCHSFSTVATGGFSTKTASIGAFSPVIQWTIILFMFICGANIAYMYFLVVKRKNLYFKQEEFKVYVSIILIATILVTFILLTNNIFPMNLLSHIYEMQHSRLFQLSLPQALLLMTFQLGQCLQK